MTRNNPPLTIGRLAKAANVNIETIRHYQRKGWLFIRGNKTVANLG